MRISTIQKVFCTASLWIIQNNHEIVSLNDTMAALIPCNIIITCLNHICKFRDYISEHLNNNLNSRNNIIKNMNTAPNLCDNIMK